MSAPPETGASGFDAEVQRGERFEFGENWARFLDVLDEDRIEQARLSLARLLGTSSLSGKSFVDVGSGSGLSSLVARRMGARVHSFDYDPASVACTAELRRRYSPDDAGWTVERGSALDPAYLDSLGTFDWAYSWGVLHHTGEMWRALDLVRSLVKPGGHLAVALYNDQGAWSSRWRAIKQTYCSGTAGRWLVSGAIIPWWVVRNLAADVVWRRNPVRRYSDYRKARGMSVWHDWHDWLGGYPFEVAKPEEVFEFYEKRGFRLVRMTTVGGAMGCNQFVFRCVAQRGEQGDGR